MQTFLRTAGFISLVLFRQTEQCMEAVGFIWRFQVTLPAQVTSNLWVLSPAQSFRAHAGPSAEELVYCSGFDFSQGSQHLQISLSSF